MSKQEELNPTIDQLRIIKRLSFALGLEESSPKTMAEAGFEITRLSTLLKSKKFKAKR
jgi:hypothetical protein